MTPTFLGWPEIKQTAYRIYKITAQDKSGSSVHVLLCHSRDSVASRQSVLLSLVSFFSLVFTKPVLSRGQLATLQCTNAFAPYFTKSQTFYSPLTVELRLLVKYLIFATLQVYRARLSIVKMPSRKGVDTGRNIDNGKLQEVNKCFTEFKNITNMRRCLKTLRQTSRTF